MFLSLYALWQKQTRVVFIFLVLGGIFPWFVMSLLDFIQGSQRSTVGRYLIGCYPFIQLAIAYGLKIVWRQTKRWCYLFFIPLLTCFLLSNTINAFQLTSWSKNPSIDLGEIINHISQANTPFILMDRGDSYTNFGNLMALNYFLPPTVQYALLDYPPETEILEQFLQLPRGDTFVYEPTKALKTELINLNYRLDLVPNTNGFFALKPSHGIK